jgi:hypothetical protein
MKISVWVYEALGWSRHPFRDMQGAMVAWRLLRASDHVAFVVIERQ